MIFPLKLLNPSLFFILLVVTFPAQGQLRLENNTVSFPKEIIFQDSFEPPGDPEPKDTKGAGSRDGNKCSANDKQKIKSLMPKRNYGLTLQKHPPVFIYLPQTKAQHVLLSFKDEVGKYYQRVFLPINSQGVISFQLPENKPPLIVGKNYQWSLVVICGQTVQPDDPTFHGWVQRVELTPQVNRKSTSQSMIWQINWYAERGYWYDMLMTILEVQKTEPNNAELNASLRKFWKSLGF